MITQKFFILLACIFILFNLSPFCIAAEESLNNDNKFKFEDSDCKEAIENFQNRINRLEPTDPIIIEDPPWEEPPPPSKVLPLTDIIQKGKKISFDIIVDNPTFKRPAYEEHWHSSIGRWSYVPIRVHYALHRLFTNYDIGISGWYDFEHNLGLTIPMFQDEKNLDLYIVTFQTQVTNVYTKGNQIVVVGNPKRNGVQVITITTRDLYPTNKKESLLVQLTTQQGDEIDYSLISYPDLR